MTNVIVFAGGQIDKIQHKISEITFCRSKDDIYKNYTLKSLYFSFNDDSLYLQDNRCGCYSEFLACTKQNKKIKTEEHRRHIDTMFKLAKFL